MKILAINIGLCCLIILNNTYAADAWSQRWESSRTRAAEHLAQANLIELMDSDYYDGLGKTTIYSNGTIELSAQVKVAQRPPYLPRFGYRLFLDNAFDTVKYYGYGPTETYIDKHHAAYKDLFVCKVTDMHEDYIKPQENSSHYDCSFVEVSDSAIALNVKSDNNFCFNASIYSQEELAEKKHNYELVPSGSTILCIDYKQSGVGSTSCGPWLKDEYQLSEKEFSFKFSINPYAIPSPNISKE